MCFLTDFFKREGLLAPRPTPQLEDHPLPAVRDRLFNLFAATILIGGRSSIIIIIIISVADACECGNEPSGSVKCGEFLD